MLVAKILPPETTAFAPTMDPRLREDDGRKRENEHWTTLTCRRRDDMEQRVTAESILSDLRRLPVEERQRFFLLLAERSFREDEDLTHSEVFGHLAATRFSAQEAADYLKISMSTFRRYVSSGRLAAVESVGRNDMFASQDLRAFKKALKQAKR